MIEIAEDGVGLFFRMCLFSLRCILHRTIGQQSFLVEMLPILLIQQLQFLG